MFPQCNLKPLALFAFTRFYLRVLADLNEIILRLKRNVILRMAIKAQIRMALQRHHILQNHNGFTLFEIILAVLILAVAIVPMLNAFSPAIFATTAQEETAVFINQARGTLNRIAVLDFETLSSPQVNPVDLAALLGSQAEADKETFTFKGQAVIPAVAIADVSGVAGGLLELTASIAAISVSTLRAEY